MSEDDDQRMLLESTLVECVDDHPLIVDARERPPPRHEEDADVV